MLEGSLWDKIIVFALPIALTGILEQMFNAATVPTALDILQRLCFTNSLRAVALNILD